MTLKKIKMEKITFKSTKRAFTQ